MIISMERRKDKRLQVNIQLDISELFKQDNIKVKNIDAPIEVINISKSGIGFQSKSTLPLDYYFNAKISLGDAASSLYTVIHIIRCDEVGDSMYIYGCEFIGMAPVLHYIFDEYEKSLEKQIN